MITTNVLCDVCRNDIPIDSSYYRLLIKNTKYGDSVFYDLCSQMCLIRFANKVLTVPDTYVPVPSKPVEVKVAS